MPAEEDSFGPLGTIGLHFVVRGDSLFASAAQASNAGEGLSLPQCFLLHGTCPTNTRVRLRLAQPNGGNPFAESYECAHLLKRLIEIGRNRLSTC